MTRRPLARNPHRRGNHDASYGADETVGDFWIIEEENGDPNKRFILVNPLDMEQVDRSFHKFTGHVGVPLFGLAFADKSGERFETRLLVWATHSDEAFERCMDWIHRYKRALITVDASDDDDDMVHSEFGFMPLSQFGVVYDGEAGSERDDLYKAARDASQQEFLDEYGSPET